MIVKEDYQNMWQTDGHGDGHKDGHTPEKIIYLSRSVFIYLVTRRLLFRLVYLRLIPRYLIGRFGSPAVDHGRLHLVLKYWTRKVPTKTVIWTFTPNLDVLVLILLF